jgi:hypothetical protein
MIGIEQKLKALESFKDWTNYLLVTTVAALGWTVSRTCRDFFSSVAEGCLHLDIRTFHCLCHLYSRAHSSHRRIPRGGELLNLWGEVGVGRVEEV